MPIENFDVDDLRGLIDRVLQIAGALPDGRFLWFRGLACATHALLPSLMRDGKTAEDVFERENRLLIRFRQRSMAYWPSGYPQNEWEHLFAMQHFGMPTRLLDWSENLFVAAHFALGKSGGHAHTGSCVPVIWCIDPIAWNQSCPRLKDFGDSVRVLTTADAEELDPYKPLTNKKRNRSPVAMFGAHNSGRIVAQRGTFMVWGNEAKPLEEFVPEQSVTIWRIQINGDREVVAEQLRHLGFTETMVFPELPALSLELSRSEGWK